MATEANSKPSIMQKFQTFMLNSKRIFVISTRPSRKEYWAMIKICALGLLIIGGLSFIIQLLANLINSASTG